MEDMEKKKKMRDRLADSVGSARGAVRRGVNKVANKLNMSTEEYGEYVVNQEIEHKRALAAAHYVNTVRNHFALNNRSGVFKLYDGVFAEELADAYQELFGISRSTATTLKIANDEFFNHIAGNPIAEVNKYYNLDTAIGTFTSVCAMVKERYATKYKVAKFEDLKGHEKAKAREIYKEFEKYETTKNQALNAVKNRADAIEKGSENCFAMTGITYPELMLIDASTRSNVGIMEDKAAAQREADGNHPAQGITEKVARLKDDIIAKRRARRAKAKKGALVAAGVGVGGMVGGVAYGGITAYLENEAKKQKEADWQEQLQEFANDYGFDNIEQLRGYIAAQIEGLGVSDIQTMQNTIQQTVVNAKLDEINEALDTNFASVEEFLEYANTHTQSIKMTYEQYVENGIYDDIDGQLIYESLDAEHERLVNEIYQEFSTDTHNFFTADGKIDMDAVDDFIARNTQEGLEVTPDVVDAKLLQVKLEAEEQRYQAAVEEVNGMEWPQDVTIYDGKLSDYVNEVESIQDVFNTENGVLLHLDELTANSTNEEKFQAILVDSHNRFGENWDNAVGWDEGWKMVDPTVTTTPDATVTGASAVPLSDSDSDILDAQVADIGDGIADTLDKTADTINEAVANSMEIIQNSMGMSFGGSANMVEVGDIDTHGILDTIGDHLSEIVASSVIISGAVMAGRMWLMRHNIIKTRDKELRKQKIDQEYIDIAEKRNAKDVAKLVRPKNGERNPVEAFFGEKLTKSVLDRDDDPEIEVNVSGIPTDNPNVSYNEYGEIIRKLPSRESTSTETEQKTLDDFFRK